MQELHQDIETLRKSEAEIIHYWIMHRKEMTVSGFELVTYVVRGCFISLTTVAQLCHTKSARLRLISGIFGRNFQYASMHNIAGDAALFFYLHGVVALFQFLLEFQFAQTSFFLGIPRMLRVWMIEMC